MRTMPKPWHESPTSVMPSIEYELATDIDWSWPGAAIKHSQPLDDGHLFWVRAAGRDYRLHIGHRARWHAEMRDDAASLVDALRAQRWIELLLEHGCVYMALEDNAYILRPCP